MFDSVKFNCPHCGAVTSVQSKAGKCVLAKYDRIKVPIRIAADLGGEIGNCKKCLHPFLIKIPQTHLSLGVVAIGKATETRCEDCGGGSAFTCNCPYDAEVNNCKTESVLCDVCYQRRTGDI